MCRVTLEKYTLIITKYTYAHSFSRSFIYSFSKQLLSPQYMLSTVLDSWNKH